MKKLEAITKLKGIRCMNSYMEKWNDETNDAEYMFVVYDQYPEEFMKFITGIKMIYANLTDTLKRFGVEEINRVGECWRRR